jgi:membrane protein
LKQKFSNAIQPIVRQINSRTGNSLEIIKLAFTRFNKVRGAEAAASVAYYSLFSLFPLLLVLVSILGYLPVVEKAPERVVNFITQAMPISRRLIEETLSQILENRGSSGVIGLIGLAWSASGVFTTLARNINRAWPRASQMDFWHSRLIALVIILLVGLLLIVTVLANTVTSIIPGINWALQLNLPLINSAALFSEVFSMLTAFLVFISLYHWVPTTQVKWRYALWGALAATVVWEIAANIYSYYLSSGLATYDLLYGSLGTIVALLTWIYVSSYIILIGAHISAATATLHSQTLEQQDQAG